MLGQVDTVEAADLDDDGFSDVSRRALEMVSAHYDHFVLGDAGRLSFELSHTSEDRRGGDQLHLRPHQASIAEEILSQRQAASVSWLHQLGDATDYRGLLSLAETDRDSYYGVRMDPNAYGETSNPLWILDTQFNHYGGRGSWTWGAQGKVDEVRDLQLGYGREIDERYTEKSLYLQHDRTVGRGLTLLLGGRVDRHSALSRTRWSRRGSPRCGRRAPT